jgi:sialate O-acetylesterase
MLSDHAVLQRNRPIHLWGWDAPGTPVSIVFHQQHASAVTDLDGHWSVYLNPEPAGGPFTLSVTGTSSATLQDILVGDVWFASGQSNMEIPLKGFPGSAVIQDAAKEIASANQPRIRLLRFDHKASDFPLADIPINGQSSAWTECTPATATEFSAVAYFFGREIAARERIPIGLIDSTWGGTPIASWMSLDALAHDASFMPVFAARARFAAQYTDLQATIAREKREDAEAISAGKPAPQHPWHPEQASWEPSFLFNGMIAPATPYTIAGFLWYQGETDSGPRLTPQLYARLFPAMIRDWRSRWAEGELPFLFVQLSSFNSPGEDWGTIRDAQRQTLALANTAIAVSLDAGLRDNVHPPDKQTVAARLALDARALVYGEKLNGEPIEYQGPTFRAATPTPGGITLWFDHAQGLHAKGGPPKDFEIAGPDGHFVPAQATIHGETVLLQSPQVPNPTQARYAWTGFSDANLYNKANLPTPTFRSQEP